MAAEQQPTDNINQEQEPRAGSFKEPKIKWKDSKARRILYKELTDGNIDLKNNGAERMMESGIRSH
jgi:hypothetical protein